MLGDDQEIEYDRLFSSLDRQRIVAFAQHSASMYSLRPRIGENTVQFRAGQATHLMAVGELAVKYVELAYVDTDRLEKRYRSAICEAAGFLHETMLQSCGYEEIVALADEAVAGIVSSVTPDIRQAGPKRLRLFANQIGLANLDAQIVALADLRHECHRYGKIMDIESNWVEIKDWVYGASMILSHLRLVLNTPLCDRAKKLRLELASIDKQVKPKR